MKEIFMAERKDEVRTRITIEAWDKRYIVESPWSDGLDIEKLLDLVYGISISATYAPETVLQAMKEYAEERLPDNNNTIEDETEN